MCEGPLTRAEVDRCPLWRLCTCKSVVALEEIRFFAAPRFRHFRENKTFFEAEVVLYREELREFGAN